MTTYFQVLDSTGTKALIDDTYRYFYKVGTVDLTAGQNSPTTFTAKKDYGAWSSEDRVMQYDCLNKWQYANKSSGSDYFVSGTCSKFMATVIPVAKNHLYAIRFKKASTSATTVWVRCLPSMFGAYLSNDSSIHSILVEVMTNNTSLTVPQALEYFEIVEIGNDNATIPDCTVGIQVYNANEEVIWNSNCKMINVLGNYSGTAGSYTYSNFTSSHLLVPNRGYTQYDMKSDSYFEVSVDRDAYSWDGSTLSNYIHRFTGPTIGTYYGYCYCWNMKDVPIADAKTVGGIIMKL